MLRAYIAALACVTLVRTSAAAEHNLRVHAHTLHANKDWIAILSTIDERLRLLETISMVQAKQARRIDVIQDKLDRVETTISLKLERAQLAAERLEHRLHMLQTNVETSIKDSTMLIERSQAKIAQITQNLTSHMNIHKHLLDKVSATYAETWHRTLLLESMMRDGLSLINATRREIANGLQSLARRHRDPRVSTVDQESSFVRKIQDNTHKMDIKMQEMLAAQKQFIDSCQREQLDDPTHVADVLYKLIDSLVNKTVSSFKELQSIHSTMRSHDNRVMKILNIGRNPQMESTCKRLETVFRNASTGNMKDAELMQLTEKFVALTNRADAALQRFEARLSDEAPAQASDVTAEADKLYQKLNGIKTEQDENYDSDNDEDENDDDDWEEDSGYYDDGGGGDMMKEDREILNAAEKRAEELSKTTTTTVRTPHRRHLHNHPYDRGPKWRKLP